LFAKFFKKWQTEFDHFFGTMLSYFGGDLSYNPVQELFKR